MNKSHEFTSWLTKGTWLEKVSKGIISLPALIPSIISLAKTSSSNIGDLNPEYFTNCLYMGNIIFAVIAITISLVIATKNDLEHNPNLEKYLEQHRYPPNASSKIGDIINRIRGNVSVFSIVWILCWCSWCLLYLLMYLNHSPHVLQFQSATQNFCNNFSSFSFLFMYLTLSTKLNWVKIVITLIIVACTMIILLIGEIAAISPITATIENSLYFTAISGLAAAVCMNLFLGRLNSLFIKGPSILIFMLFVYASIQPLYFISEITRSLPIEECFQLIALERILDNVYNCILAFALCFKLILFLIVTWVIDTRRLEYAIIKEGEIYYHNSKDFSTYLEVRN